MRILTLTNHYPPHSFGNYELQCYSICHELAHRGHQIHTLTSTEDSSIGHHQLQPTVFRELELYSKEADEEPSFHRLFGLVRKNRRILKQHLEAFLPEAVMVWGMDRLPTSLLEMVESSRIPCLYCVYDFWLADACQNDHWARYWDPDGIPASSISRPVLQMLGLKKMVAKRAAIGGVGALQFENIYFCSEFLKRKTVKACGLPLDSARIVPCGIAPGEIRPRRGQKLAQNFHVMYLAPLDEGKDPLTAIRAIQELRRRGDERFSLDIYGRGPSEYEAALHDYVRRFQLGGAVSFKPVNQDHVRNSIHLYDALVFTSRKPEPFPLVHLKAMAARVPVISTPHGGAGELIHQGENGITFEAGNPHDLAEKLLELANDPAGSESIADRAHAEVTQHYSLNRITSRIESLLYRATKSEGMIEEAV